MVAVTSLAYSTTLNGRPFASAMGLYEDCSQTSRPPLAMRFCVLISASPRASLAHNARYSALPEVAASANMLWCRPTTSPSP